MNLKDFFFVAGLFYIIPFFVVIFLPSWLIPRLVRRLVNRKREKLPSLVAFTLALCFGAFLANLFWEKFLFNHVYYEWDRVFLAYTFIHHERPLLDGSSSWIAHGWSLNGLEAVWASLTGLIYVSAGLFAVFNARKEKNRKAFQRVILFSVIGLTIFSTAIPVSLMALFTFVYKDATNVYQEVDLPCPVLSSDSHHILYSGNNRDLISDLDGKNLQPLDQKTIELYGNRALISPDTSKSAKVFMQDLWVGCLHSKGIIKIHIAEDNQNETYLPSSLPSWSPDSKNLVMNRNGDLVIIDTEKKTTQVFFSKIAIRDNHVDITAKDRDKMLPPFEVGDAYWAGDDLIYYTEFKGTGTVLHQLNLNGKGKDEVVIESPQVLRIQNGSPDGKWLLIWEGPWQGPEASKIPSKTYFWNTRTRKVRPISEAEGRLDEVVFSPSGKFFGTSSSSWSTDPVMTGLPATVSSLDEVNLYFVDNALVDELKKRGIETENKAVSVSIKDFLNDQVVLLNINIWGKEMGFSHAINALYNVETKEFTLLSDFPAAGYGDPANDRERQQPLQFIR